MERIWASAFHIGAALLLIRSPWLVLLLVPLHSGLNLAAVKLSAKSMKLGHALIAVVGLATLAAGWIQHGS